MNDKAIKALAALFTGPNVAHNSIALQAGGVMATRAKAYFDAREAVGLREYEKAEDAEKIIRATLAKAVSSEDSSK